MFLIQLILAVISWKIAHYLYENSDWLNSNKPVEVTFIKHSRLRQWVEKIIKTETSDTGQTVLIAMLVLFLIPAIICGAIFAIVALKGAYDNVEEFLGDYNWWQQNLMIFGLILCFYAALFEIKNRKNK